MLNVYADTNISDGNPQKTQLELTKLISIFIMNTNKPNHEGR